MNKHEHYFCDVCDDSFKSDYGHIDDSGNYCKDCYKAMQKQSALDAGIPLSVIEGKTKLTDHFSQEYIDSQCGRIKK